MKTILPVLFLFILLVLLVSANIYLARRFSIYFSVCPYKVWQWIFAGVSVAMFTTLIVFSVTTNPVGSILWVVSSILIGFFIYLLLSVIIVDLISLIIKMSPSTRGFIAIGLALFVSGYGLWKASTIKVREIVVPMAGLSEEIKTVHLTDIHLGHFRGKRFLDKVVSKTNELNPDVVFNTGDLFDARSRLKEDVLLPFTKITTPHYFVEGNHDKYVGIEEITILLKNAGVKVLENEITYFKGLQIVGLKHMLADNETFDMHAEESEKTIKDILNSLPIEKDKPTILLHHSPDGAKYADEKNINLELAGHTHGGQFFPFNFLAGWLFFKYNSGIYTYNQLIISVSEGIGTFFSPMRIGTQSEIIFIKLTPKTNG